MSFKAFIVTVFVFAAGLGAGYFIFAAEGNVPMPAVQTAVAVPASVQSEAIITDEAAVRRIVEAYIKENPVVIMQSVNDFQQNGQLRQIEARAEPYLAVLQKTEGSAVVGADSAQVKIIEFFDYQCPHCKANYGVLQQLLAEDSSVALMPKYLPILGDGSDNDMSLYGARAAEAARLQGKFVPFHEALMQSQLPLSRESVEAVALRVGIDIIRFNHDVRSEQVAEAIAASRAIADEIGISQAGTPGYIVGGKVMIGAAPDSYDRLKAMIEAARPTG